MLETIKESINFLGDPKYSFTMFSIVFLWALFQRKVWTKQGTIIAMATIAIGLFVALLDHNFAVTLLKPDNAPIFLMIFIFGFCLWLAMTQAHNNDRRAEQKLPPIEKETSDQKTWVWPDLVYIEFLCMILATAFLVVWSLAVRAPLEEPANPGNTPNPSKAPWYFLGLQELLVYFDPWFAGVVMPSIIVIGLMAIPYIDVNKKGNGYYTFKDRKLAIITFMIGFMIFWNFLIVIGTVLRGPGWNFFGPFEHWNPHKVVALTNVNLSEWVWVKILYPLGHDVIGNNAVGNFLAQGIPNTTGDYMDLGNVARVFFLKEIVGTLFLIWWFIILPGRLAMGPRGNFFTRLCRRVADAFGLSRFRPLEMLLKGTQKLYQDLGFGRYSVAILLFLFMATVPLKMYLRWLVNLKYLLDTPWLKF
jgi:hypothetical protein